MKGLPAVHPAPEAVAIEFGLGGTRNHTSEFRCGLMPRASATSSLRHIREEQPPGRPASGRLLVPGGSLVIELRNNQPILEL
ncbi:hypothetical protein GCM10010211_42690 [Streptomyces albospinus]|uniref:Uncharacterized protein n=1 Tax=Streptomyces albospinus TaxID=285515 RepID=A0ABQ2VAX3_9ACTN|nr:hypothetical protein [Streptomyces albospinus]GGU72203.1 hypothetical protein GCM10010211_42690 [Streptomyces albospinus]